MATIDYSKILVIINQTGLIKSNPALYASLTSLIDSGKLVVQGFNDDIAALKLALNNTFTYGTHAERLSYKPTNTVGNLIFFYETDTNRLYVWIGAEQAWFPIGPPIDATYLTWTDQHLELPQSRWLIAGTGIGFDDTVANKRTISASGGSGLVPMCNGDWPAMIMYIGKSVLMIPYPGD